MSAFNAIPFVSAVWLAERLQEPNLAIVDGSWHLPPTGRNGRAEYDAAHLPGAVFFDLDQHSDTNSNLPHMLPPATQFAETASAMGISNEKTIVVYDQTGLFSAPRVAWMFAIYGAKDVRILEGGLPGWIKAGLSVTNAPATPMRAEFKASMQTGVVASLDDVARALESDDLQVVDARPAPRFQGLAPEPRPGVRAGHMPGSLNLPFDKIVSEGGLKSKDEIKAALDEAGIDLAQPVICSCGSGVSAAIIAMAIEKAGGKVQAVYDGSWAEWGSSDRPIGTATS